MTDTNAHAIVPDSTGKFVFVPHTGSNGIYQFGWDDKAEMLRPNTPVRLDTPAKTGPRHLAWHPARPVAYIDNEQGSRVTSYRLDRLTGLLKTGSTCRTVPEGFAGSNRRAEIKIDPSGQFGFVSNRGHDSLATFRIDEGEGITALGQTPTEATTRSFDIDPSGRFLIAAGEASGHLTLSRIDPATGALAKLQRYQIAPRLWWVLAVDVPRLAAN